MGFILSFSSFLHVRGYGPFCSAVLVGIALFSDVHSSVMTLFHRSDFGERNHCSGYARVVDCLERPCRGKSYTAAPAAMAPFPALPGKGRCSRPLFSPYPIIMGVLEGDVYFRKVIVGGILLRSRRGGMTFPGANGVRPNPEDDIGLGEEMDLSSKTTAANPCHLVDKTGVALFFFSRFLSLGCSRANRGRLAVGLGEERKLPPPLQSAVRIGHPAVRG